MESALDQGNTTFLLISAAFVLLMTPGLAFFYGGMVKAKSVVSMMMLSFGSLGLVGVLWVLYGYAIAFADGPSDSFGAGSFAVAQIRERGGPRSACPSGDCRS